MIRKKYLLKLATEYTEKQPGQQPDRFSVFVVFRLLFRGICGKIYIYPKYHILNLKS